MEGMNISREVAMIPALPGVDAEYLMYLLASPAGQALMAGQVRGVAQSGINLSDLRQLPCALPPIEEQREIVRVVSQAMEKITAAKRQTSAKLRMVDTLQQATLARAFRGELVPTEAELARREGRAYEDAVALLARVRAERNGAAKPKSLQRPPVHPPPRRATDTREHPPTSP